MDRSIFSNPRRRKGQIQSFGTIIYTFFALAIVLVIISGAFDDINDVWQSNEAFSNTSKQVVTDYNSKFSNQWDFGFAFLLISAIIAGIVGLFLLDTHPIIFVVSILAVISLLIVVAFLANSYSDVSEEGEFSTWIDDFPIIQFVMSYYLETMIIISGIFGLAIFAKVRS